MLPNYFSEEKDLRKFGIKCGSNCRMHSTVIVSHPENLKLGNNVRIGSNATILPVNIGHGAVIGAGAVVTKDVPAHTTVYGNPAKIKGKTKRFATPHSLNILLVQGVNYALLKN